MTDRGRHSCSRWPPGSSDRQSIGRAIAARLFAPDQLGLILSHRDGRNSALLRSGWRRASILFASSRYVAARRSSSSMRGRFFDSRASRRNSAAFSRSETGVSEAVPTTGRTSQLMLSQRPGAAPVPLAQEKYKLICSTATFSDDLAHLARNLGRDKDHSCSALAAAFTSTWIAKKRSHLPSLALWPPGA
jgi:hypothetical protein